MAHKRFIVVDPGSVQAMGINQARKLRCSFDKKLDHTAIITDASPVSIVGVQHAMCSLFFRSAVLYMGSCSGKVIVGILYSIRSVHDLSFLSGR